MPAPDRNEERFLQELENLRDLSISSPIINTSSFPVGGGYRYYVGSSPEEPLQAIQYPTPNYLSSTSYNREVGAPGTERMRRLPQMRDARIQAAVSLGWKARELITMGLVGLIRELGVEGEILEGRLLEAALAPVEKLLRGLWKVDKELSATATPRAPRGVPELIRWDNFLSYIGEAPRAAVPEQLSATTMPGFEWLEGEDDDNDDSDDDGDGSSDDE